MWYSNAATATQLPATASEGARMLADPPIFLPFLLVAGFIALFAWSFWPQKEDGTPSEGEYGVKSSLKVGDDSTNLQGNFEGANFDIGPKASTTGDNSPAFAVGGDAQFGPRRINIPQEAFDEMLEYVRENSDNKFTIWHTRIGKWLYRPHEGRDVATDNCPAYTASIDAAMQLVPPCPSLSGDPRDTEKCRFVLLAFDRMSTALCYPDDDTSIKVHAKTPALALTAASLRARAAMESE